MDRSIYLSIYIGTGVLLQVYGEGYSQKSGSAAAYELGLPCFFCFLFVKLVGLHILCFFAHVIFLQIGFSFVLSRARVCVCVCVCVCIVVRFSHTRSIKS